MASTKSVKVEGKTAEVVEQKEPEVVEQKEPEVETKVEVDNSSAEEAAAPEINSVDGENCKVVGAQCVEGGEPEIILGQTMSEEEENLVVDENGEVNPEEKVEEEAKVNLTSGVASTVVNDPICGNRAVFQPQVSINNYQSTDAVARGENARRGEIIKRC